jgi:hypothetical protein
MADIQELIDSRQYTIDRTGKEAGTRVFRVLQAQNEVGAKDEFRRLAGFDQFPGASSGCILDNVSVEGKNGNTVFIVTANYSSFGGFLGPRENTAFAPFMGWGYRKVTVRLPFLYQATITTSSGENVDITNLVWLAKTVDIVETRLIRTYKVRYQTSNINDLDRFTSSTEASISSTAQTFSRIRKIRRFSSSPIHGNSIRGRSRARLRK